jgi:hypothetical protein
LRELGPWKPGERTEQKLGWLASFVVSEAVATHNNNVEVKEWASKFFQTLSKAIGKERAHVFGVWLGEKCVAFQGLSAGHL